MIDVSKSDHNNNINIGLRGFRNHPKLKMSFLYLIHKTSLHSSGFLLTVHIPKLLQEIFKKLTTHHNAHTCVSTPGKVHFIEMGSTKLIYTQNVGLKIQSNYNVNTCHKQNLTMNITAKRRPNLSFKSDKNKLDTLINFDYRFMTYRVISGCKQ